MKEIFNQTIEKVNVELKTAKTITSRISFLRLIIFLVFLILLFIGFTTNDTLYTLFSLISLVIFMMIIINTNCFYEKVKFLHAKNQVLKNYLYRYDYGYRNFYDGSKGNEKTIFSSDLHIIGKSSLYQYINQAYSAYGKKRVLDAVLLKDVSKKRINLMQETADDIEKNRDFVFDFVTTSMQNFNNDPKTVQYYDELFSYKPQENKVLTIVSLVIPYIALISLILGFINPVFITFAVVLYSFLALLTFKLIKMNNEVFALYLEFRKAAKFKNIFEKMANLTVTSQLMQNLQKQAFQYAKELHHYENTNSLISFRSNCIFAFIFNLFIGLDSIILLKIRKQNYDFKKYYDLIAMIEEIISLNTINLVNEVKCMPEITDEKVIKAESIYHPLIKDAVTNNFYFPFDNYIITGSNMSGKTTFLRSIGINLVLAFSGSMVCAKEFSSPLITILTSLSLSDDLSNGISSFYAEVIRIKEILENVDKPGLKLVLVDEIFKGTNSLDRIEGAKKLLLRLKRADVLSVFTTHDFELCDESLNTKNYHFEEHYIDNKIYFDYQLKKGRCQTTNAIYLMKMAGIIKE